MNKYDIKRIKDELEELIVLERSKDRMPALFKISELESKYHMPINDLFDKVGALFSNG